MMKEGYEGMGKPYSLDLRTRVIAAVRGGMKRKHASQLYKINRRTLYNWFVLEEEQGHVKPKSDYQRGHSHSITDLEAFRQYVEGHAAQTQEEMAMYFGNGSSSVGRALKKIGFSRKKRVAPILNEMKKKDRIT